LINTDQVASCEKCRSPFGESPGFQTATFWQRSKALVLDMVLFAAPIQFFRMIGFSNSKSSSFLIVASVSYYIYSAAMESSRFQGTLGKILFNLQVIDTRARPISFGRATLRYLAKSVSAIGLAGYLMPLFNRQRLALHDILSHSRVVNVPADRVIRL
jgi:uncharacterized RDD family membrane protein YckC